MLKRVLRGVPPRVLSDIERRRSWLWPRPNALPSHDDLGAVDLAQPVLCHPGPGA